MKYIKLMSVKLNIVNLLIILLITITLSYCINKIIKGLYKKEGFSEKVCLKGCNLDKDSNSYMCSNNNTDNVGYTNNTDYSGYCKFDTDCSNCNNGNNDHKIPSLLIDNILKKESEVSDDLKIFSNFLGHGGSGLNMSNNTNLDNSGNNKGDGSWDDYWGMGVGDKRSYNNYNKNDNNPSSIHVTSNGTQILATPQNTVDGIPSSHIPSGHEDLYILKSNVVPPVCPACPNVIVDKTLLNKECEPCPPCARCPEPAFDCKKVPNYSLGQTNSYLPRPILNDFSTFGA